MGSALGSAAGGIGSALGSAGSGIASGLGELGGALGSAFGSGGGEAGYLASLGQAVPAGVEMVGPSAALSGGEAGALFPAALSQGSSAIPASFGQVGGAAAKGSGWTQLLGQILGGQGGGGDPQSGGGPGQNFNIMNALSPESIMKGLDPGTFFGKQAPAAPQLSLPAPNVPQTAPQDRLSFLRAFNLS